jgi:hypothetical protein
VAKRLYRTLCLAAVGATVLLVACAGHAVAPSSPSTSPAVTVTPVPSTSPAAIAAQPPGSAVTTTERVDAWSADGGQAELSRLSAAIVAVGRADAPGGSYAALGKACAREAAAVASAQAGPQVPDAAAQASYAAALADYARSAADCQAGTSAHDVALLNKAAAATRAGTADVLRFDNETRDAQSQAAQSAAARRCQQQYQAWKHGPASAALSQLLAALKALQVAGSGTSLPAITSAAHGAGQPAAQLARFPVPPCADPGGDFAAILASVRTAAAGAGTAQSLSAVVHALAPLKDVPALEADFTAEVKLTAGG